MFPVMYRWQLSHDIRWTQDGGGRLGLWKEGVVVGKGPVS